MWQAFDARHSNGPELNTGKPVLAPRSMNATSTPDGVSYGSRWSRAKRETTGFMCGMGFDSGWSRGSNTRRRELNPRPLPRSENWGRLNPVVSRFARDHRLPYVSPSGDGSRGR
jgi:hypothetical protein